MKNIESKKYFCNTVTLCHLLHRSPFFWDVAPHHWMMSQMFQDDVVVLRRWTPITQWCSVEFQRNGNFSYTTV